MIRVFENARGTFQIALHGPIQPQTWATRAEAEKVAEGLRGYSNLTNASSFVETPKFVAEGPGWSAKWIETREDLITTKALHEKHWNSSWPSNFDEAMADPLLQRILQLRLIANQSNTNSVMQATAKNLADKWQDTFKLSNAEDRALDRRMLERALTVHAVPLSQKDKAAGERDE